MYFRIKNTLKNNHYHNIRCYNIKYPLLMRKNTHAIEQGHKFDQTREPKNILFIKKFFFYFKLIF